MPALLTAVSRLSLNYCSQQAVSYTHLDVYKRQALGRTALTQNYRVAVSGKTEKMNYSLAYSFYNEEGAMVYSGTKKHNISFNTVSYTHLDVYKRQGVLHITCESGNIQVAPTDGDGRIFNPVPGFSFIPLQIIPKGTDKKIQINIYFC